MRIALNCRSILLKKRTGIGRYTYHLLDTLGKIDPSNQYILHAPQNLFSRRRNLPDFSRYKNFHRKVDFFQQGPGKSDIYHLPCPDKIGPFLGKLIVTVHDIVHRTYPQSQTAAATELSEKYISNFASRADHIICISENTRQDLQRFYNVPSEKTSVVYFGVDHQAFYPLADHERLAAQAQIKELGIDKPFILYVGTIEPRKNLIGLLESFAQLKRKKIFQGQLVVAGMKGWMVESLGEQIKKLDLSSDVVFAGFVSDVQLRQLYNLTEVFVLPSFYEGFGFPILEAFCCGAAVITSKTSSCGEIAAEAGLTVDPHDQQDITQAMEKVLSDKVLRSSLGRAGLKRSQEFSFERMAQGTLDVYQRALRL